MTDHDDPDGRFGDESADSASRRFVDGSADAPNGRLGDESADTEDGRPPDDSVDVPDERPHDDATATAGGSRVRRDRPVTEASYGVPEDEAGMLTWEFVETRMTEDRIYWVSTTRPDGRPHARPTWGVWIDGTFHCGGGERTRWVRNLASNPGITVHRESGTDVVVIEGVAEELTASTADGDLLERIDDAYEEKYGTPHGTPVFAVRPRTVLAWSDFPSDATRWRFPAE
jgi:hypothetical protein